MVSRNKSPSLFGFAIFRTYLSFLPHSPGLSHMVVPFVYCKGTLPRSEIHQVEHLPSGGTFSNSSTGMDASFYQRYYGHWDPNYLIHFPGRAKLSSIYFWWQHVYLKYYFLMPSANIQNDITFKIDICVILNQEGMNNIYDKLNPIKQ